MRLLEQLAQADRDRILSVPLEQRRAWKKNLVVAAKKFNDDLVIKNTADGTRERAVRSIMAALPHVIERDVGVYDFYQNIHSEETAALQEFFKDKREFERLIHAIARAQGFKPIKEWDPAEIKALIRERYDNNIHTIRCMAETLIQSGDLDRGTWDPIDRAFQSLVDFIRIPESNDYLAANGVMGFDWNKLRRGLLGKMLYEAPEDSVSKRLCLAILGAAERSGLFQAIEQAYGDTNKGKSLAI